MPGLQLTIVLFLAWLVVVLLTRWTLLPLLRRGPGRDPTLGLLWYLVRAFCRLLHRPTYRGQLVTRQQFEPGGLVVVSNHTGAIDPLLIQSACRFPVRWMMAEEQMGPSLDWLWKLQRFIPVARDGTDSGPLREAIRHVRSGGVLGIFPEGRIVTPPEQVWPFFAGVGVIIARTKAPVLLVWVSGTPATNQLSESLLTPSHAHVEFVDRIEFKERDGTEITRILRQRLHDASGWPINDATPEPVPVPQLQLG